MDYRRRFLLMPLRMRFVVGMVFFVSWLAGMVTLFYEISIHIAAGTSDKATTLLAGQDMGSGNILLHGWILPPGNYWTSDVALYALPVRLLGLHPGLLYLEPAVVAALTVVMSMLLIRELGPTCATLAGSFTVGVLLVFSTPPMALWFVGNAFHILTALFTLIAFLALTRNTFGWRWAISVALLSFGMLGDLEIVAFAMIPLALGGVSAMLRRRSWRAGVAQVSAAIASAVIGELALRLTAAFGAFRRGPSLPVAHFHQMVTNLGHVFSFSAELVGLTNGRFGTAGIPIGLLGVHFVGGVLTVLGLIVALERVVAGVVRGAPQGGTREPQQESWRLDDLLLFGTVGSTVLFVVLAGVNGLGIHFLSVPVLFASILTGRMVARAWPRLSGDMTRRTVSVIGVAVSLALASGIAVEISLPAPQQPVSGLIAFLKKHHLHNGVGGYWAAAITTVVSRGEITVRPVEVAPNGKIRRMMTQSNDRWYHDNLFQFVVGDTLHAGNVTAIASRKTWGTPVHTYVVGQYRVYVWDRDLRISAFPPGAKFG